MGRGANSKGQAPTYDLAKLFQNLHVIKFELRLGVCLCTSVIQCITLHTLCVTQEAKHREENLE